MRSKVITMVAVLLTLCFAGGCAQIPPKDSPEKEKPSQQNQEWKEIDEGLTYKEFHLVSSQNKTKDLVLAVIDPTKYGFSIYQNPSKNEAKTIKEIHEETGAPLILNGGFFTEEFKPTGLLISEGQKIRETSNAKLLEGIFAVTAEGQAKLLDQKAELKENTYPFAIQNGPVILDEKGAIKIDRETGEIASRTAIGLDKDNNIIVIVLKQSLLNSDNQISFYEFAHLLTEAPELKAMELHSVLNLDGGPSSGIMIGESYYPEMERVQNVILVKKQ